MKMAVVCSNGKVGRLVVAEALRRGFDVTGFARSENVSDTKQCIKKDIFDITAHDLAGFDAVVDAFGTFTPDTLDLHTKSLMHLADAVAHTDIRLLAVGGAGSLYMDTEHTLQLLDTKEFPKEYYSLAKAQADELTALRKRNDVKWTFISPAAVFDPDGKQVGDYILGGEEFTLNERGESVVSYADYAIAVVDEIENGDHIQQRISIVGK